MMQRLAICALAVALIGCGSDSTNPDDGPLVTEGGTFTVESCGYDLTTRVGATAPQLGTAEHGDDPTPRLLHLGFSGEAHNSMAILWRTVDETTLSSTVQFAEGADLSAAQLDQSFEGITFVYLADFGGEALVRMHEAHLCGLNADTEYTYRVGGAAADGTEVWSDTRTFRTAPDPASTDATVVLGMLGDSRDGYDIWEQLIELTATFDPDVILFTGDAVTIGGVQFEWESFFEAAEGVLSRAPIITAHGNHEINSVHFYSQFAMPGDEEDFSFRYGPAHITVLNDSPLEESNIAGKSATLLDTDLAATDAPWKLMMHHRSFYSASTRREPDETLKSAWLPIIDRHAVDMVLSGHDHIYERSKPMRGDAPQPTAADGTIYIVSGGAGASLYGTGTDVWTEVAEATFNTSIITITGGTSLETTSYREDGTVVDTVPAIVKP